MSADHVEYAAAEDAAALAASGSVAVLLPGASYTLHETQAPPVDAFRAAGVDMALATDCNPGSSPLASLLLAMKMVCTLFRLTPEEALRCVTQHGARAMLLHDCGQITPGSPAIQTLFWRAVIILTTEAVGLETLEDIWRGADAVELNRDARPAVETAAALVAKAAAGTDAVYGVNTGFGKLANHKIALQDTETFQRNLILSHCCGVGDAFCAPLTRLMMVLKFMSLGRGASGARWEVCTPIEGMMNEGCLRVIPAQGPVGASGDLAPLAHMAAAMIGACPIVRGAKCSAQFDGNCGAQH